MKLILLLLVLWVGASACFGADRLDIEDYATIEAYVGKEEIPVYAFGYTYVYGVSPDLLPDVVMQEGNTNPVAKFKPKKSWEIRGNFCGSTAPREPKTAWNDDQPLLPIHLIDGDPETAWSSQGSNVPDRQPEWIRIDLPAESTVASVILVCSQVGPRKGDYPGFSPIVGIGKTLPTSLTIRLSRDARQWETVYESKDFSGPDSGPSIVSFDPRPAKQIWVIADNLRRLQGAVGNWRHCFSIGELEVRDPAGNNLALVSRGAGVQVSSTYHGFGMDRFTQDMLWPIQYDLGFKWTRVGYDMGMFTWSYVEREKGRLRVDPRADEAISDAARRGVNVIMCLDKGNWLYHDPPRKADWKKARVREMMETYYDHPGWPTISENMLKGYLRYVDYMVRHFRGRVACYEILNEWVVLPNWHEKMDAAGTVEEYVRLLKAVIPVIRQADPAARIMIGSLATVERDKYSWILRVIEKLRDSGLPVDAVGWHPFYQADPDDPGFRRYREDVARFKTDCAALGFKGQYAATEWTWAAPYPSAADHTRRADWCTEMTKAKYSAQLMTAHCGMEVISFYNETFQTAMIDWGDTTLLRNAFSVDPITAVQPQAIYYVLRSISTVTDGFKSADFPVEFAGDRQFECYTFKRGEDELMLAAWIPGRTTDGIAEAKTDVILPGVHARRAWVLDVFNGTEQELNISQTDDGTVLRAMLIKDYPVFIRMAADSRQWAYYSLDEFETSVLRPRWLVRDTTVTLSGGRIHLTNASNAAGTVALKSLYGFGESRIYLYWPWAIQTRIDTPADVSCDGGVTITFGDGSGWSSRLDAGVRSAQGRTFVYYAVDGDPAVDWTGGRIAGGEGLCLRVEGIGEDRRTVRVGAKERESDPWVWSGELKLDRPARYAQPMALRNGPATGESAPGSRVTTSFDYVRLEGKSFDPGVFHRDDSEYLKTLSDEQKKELKAAGLSVGYVRSDIPKVVEPLPSGERYKARVPDTLDLAERMSLSLNAITEGVDRGADCEPYCHVFASPEGWTNSGSHYNPDMERRAPVLLHDFHGYNVGIGEGWVEDIPLLRLATGDTRNLEVSQAMFDNLRRMIGDDGLPCFPLSGRPWALFLAWWIDDPQTGRPMKGSDLTMSGEYAWGRFLSTLAAWYEATGSPELREEIEKMVLAFDRLDRERPDMPLGMTTEYGLVQAYKATRFEPARDLARRLLSRTRARKFRPDGSFSGHFHGTTFSVLAMAELATATNDQELLGFVKKAYEFAVSKGWPAVGFYPEAVDQDPPNQETCSFTHLPRIAAILSLAGMGDYWDDIDCLARNQMAENQLTDYRWIYRMAGEMPDFKTPTPVGYDSVRDVGKRLIGGFAGFASLNDYFKPVERAPGPINGCCTGNGARALYCVWQHILHARDGALYVNLLLNRASKLADIASYIPYQGRVDVKMKTSMPLFVRMPGWVDTGKVTCTVDGRKRSLTWQGRYASPGMVAAGSAAVFEFPIQEKTLRLKIGDVDAALVLRGSTVVDITPQGKHCPLYRGREKHREGEVRWKTITRFVPDRTIDW